MTYEQNYCCKDDEHTFVRAEPVAVLVPALDSKPRQYEVERCSKCGAIRRARGLDGQLIGDAE